MRVILASGLFDHPHPGGGEVDTPEQRAIALQGATEGIVLLKNERAICFRCKDATKIHAHRRHRDPMPP